MTAKVSGYASSALAYKLVSDDNASDTPVVDATGTTGTLYAISVNQTSSSICYLKMKITSGTVAVGTTQPDLVFEIPSSEEARINFPAGLPFTQLSFWVTDAVAYDDTGDPGTVLLTFLCA